MEKYVFKTSHSPLNLDDGLAKLTKTNSQEWALISSVLESTPELSSGENINVFIAKIISSWNLGQLIEHCLTQLPIGHQLSTLLCDLVDDYSPIKLDKQNLNLQEIIADLGQDLSLQVKGQGVPSLVYQWFFWPSNDHHQKDWTPLDVHEAELHIDDLSLEDIGIYKCFVQHQLKVLDENGGDVPGMFTAGVQIKLNPHAIQILEQSETTECDLMEDLTLFVKAVASSPLKYQWFFNDKLLSGQCTCHLELYRLNFDQGGQYKCVIKNELGDIIESKVIDVIVQMPSIDHFQSLEFKNEAIQILKQPTFAYDQAKSAIGEKIHLTCLAACKYPLKYEWLRKGVRIDLFSKSTKSTIQTNSVLVSLGCQLIDEIQDVHPPVSYYVYQCIIKCVQTGERVMANQIKVPVSTYTLPDKALPEFKIALLICQEQYDQSDFFHPLDAPRSDGIAVAKALQEVGFEVIALSNLTVEEIRKAVDVFCTFINEQTYAFFYFNGHALGHGSDIYLVGKDTHLLTSQEFIWHGEIEMAVDRQRPLFATMVYDSCRDQLPTYSVFQDSTKDHPPIQCESNFCVGYGTRQSMRSFVKMDKSGTSQSLYTKYLLQHLNVPNISVGTMFERLNCSFTQGEDAAIVAFMKPEFKDSTRQSFCLSAPLRSAQASKLHQDFFSLCRIESMTPTFEDAVTMQLGITLDDQSSTPIWIKGKTYKTPEILLKLNLENHTFLNEADLEVSVVLNKNEDWMDKCSVLLIPLNIGFIVDQQEYEANETNDGAIFEIDALEQGQKCHLSGLQSVQEPAAKFRLVLIFQEEWIPCKGILSLNIPICKNIPLLKICNR